MNRAFYIKRNGLFVPDKCRMNPAFLGSWPKPSGGGGGGTSSPFITAFPSDGTTSVPSNQDGYGFKFTVGSSALVVTDLGFRVNATNTGVHTVSIFNNTGGLVVNGTVDLTGQSAGTVVYGAVSAATLTAGASYYCIATMATGEKFQNDTSLVTTTTDATIIESAYHDGSGFHVFTFGSHAFGIPNFKYHL